MRRYLRAAPDKTVAFVAEMDFDAPGDGPVVYTCPMHPEVISEEPGRCPDCGMKLLPRAIVDQAAGAHEHGAATTTTARRATAHEAAGGIEWEDDMVEVNRITTPANMRWKLIDRTTGAENHAIAWQFRVGDRVKIRLVNEMDSDHPMHHPFHIHGAGRFLSWPATRSSSRTWCGATRCWCAPARRSTSCSTSPTPAVWMAHCHIAEHHESGMMFSFDVTA